MTLIFFSILSFYIKSFALELCHFSTSFSILLFQERVSQANLGQLAFSFAMFFLT